jgi:DNA polymerase-3 subunit delta'
MQFKKIIGHQAIKQRLIQTAMDQRIPHAQLFMGPEGNGKLALAIAYAQYINCTDKSATDSCGVCSSCVKYEKLIHPDLHFIYPVAATKEFSSKPVSIQFIPKWRNFLLQHDFYVNLSEWYSEIEIEKKQGSISVHDAAEIIRSLNYMSYEAEYKVMIIWMIEKMHHAASPKLLKILEEPPDKTLFLLITENPDQIMSTIISRAQILKIPKITDEDLYEALKDHTTGSQDELRKYISLSDGNFLELKKWFARDDEEGFYFRSFRTWMRMCFAAKIPEIMVLIEEIASLGRERQKQFLQIALRFTRDCLLSHYKSANSLKLEGEELEFAEKFSPFVHRGNSYKIVEELNKAINQIERNANISIMMMDMSLQFIPLLKMTNPDKG